MVFADVSYPEAPLLIWGVGRTFVIATATNDILGQGKLSLGPSVVVLTQPGPRTIGALANNVWSVAGSGGRPPVNQFLLQYFVNYNLKRGGTVPPRRPPPRIGGPQAPACGPFPSAAALAKSPSSASSRSIFRLRFTGNAVIGAAFRNDILNRGKHLVDFKGPGIAFVVIIFSVALLPLLFFIPKLLPLRRKGVLKYSSEENETEVIAAPEISTLRDYNSAYNNVEDMYPIPVDNGALTGLALSIAIPALPVILAEIPIQVVLQDLLSASK